MKLIQFSRFTWPYICLYLFFSAQLQELSSEGITLYSKPSSFIRQSAKPTLDPLSANSGKTSLIIVPRSTDTDLRDFRKELGDLTN